MKNSRSPRHSRAQTGFTLVEMSVVLLVIGLIIGAVSIGKDMQRNAEYSKVKQKFIDQWANAYNTYYVRSGVVLGDSQIQPRIMVNGANFNATVAAGGVISGENMTSADGPAQICQYGADASTTAPAGGSGVALNSLHREMDRLGVRMPPGRSEGFEDRYVYLDSNGNPQELVVCFQWNKPGTESGSGNVMIIYGLTPDLARSLDQMIDGKADARRGVFRQAGVTGGTNGSPGEEWKANNTYDYSSATATAASSGANKDEDQVKTVVAHYKMNQ